VGPLEVLPLGNSKQVRLGDELLQQRWVLLLRESTTEKYFQNLLGCVGRMGRKNKQDDVVRVEFTEKS
jgi:hypothetical protein